MSRMTSPKSLRPLVYFVALSAAGATMANGRDRFEEDIWHPNPKQFESTADTEQVPPEDDYDEHDDLQSEEEMTVDVDLLAQESGMSYAEAERAIKAQDAFGRYADKLLARFPDRIARMWKEPAPSTQSHIEFVGEIPEAVLEDIAQNGKPDDIDITDGGILSFKDQVKRAQIAAKGLRQAGYDNSLSFYNPANDVIELEIKIPEHAKNPDPNRILDAIRNEQLRGTELRDRIRSLTGNDIRIKTIRGEGPIMEFDHARGGNWVRDDGFRECTSGWAVSGPNGDGIITAAHCTGLNQFEEEGGLVFNMAWRDQEFGSGGDVEYHTTNHIELDDFYARQNEIRDVSGIRSTWSMWGASVCEYGRSSNTRTCNHTVNGLFVTVNYSIGTVNNLVRVTGDNSIGGDSGGGWSFNYTAWGVHSGSNGSQSYFTPAQQAEAILNVTIKR